jgi:hypothetical protein
MNKIDAMGATKDFTYGFNQLPAGSQVGGTVAETKQVDGKDKTTILMNAVSEANGVHELTHGFQGTLGKMYTFSATGANFPGPWTKAYNVDADSEIEAYKAQYAFDATGFPTSSFTGKSVSANSLSDINTTFVGGIVNPSDSKPLYPWIQFKAVIMSIFGNGGK